MTKDATLVTSFSLPYLHEIFQFRKDKKTKKLNRFYKKKNINLFRWNNFPWKKSQESRSIGPFYKKP